MTSATVPDERETLRWIGRLVVKHLILFAAVLLVACDDTIPGSCKVDSDCKRYSSVAQSVCYQGICVAADLVADGGDGGDGGGSVPHLDGGVGDAEVQDAGLMVLGAACSSPGQCASGNCADGVCCDAPCNDHICQRCDSYSAGGVGRCNYTKAGVDPEGECSKSTTSCHGLCSLQTTTYSCAGTGYACSSETTTSPIPSGSVCASNAAVKVSTTNNCGSGNNCVDGACQASQWWTSCNGQGACRAAGDSVDALVQSIVAAAGNSLTSTCGANGTSFCGDSCVGTGVFRDLCDGAGHCVVTGSQKTDCGLFACDTSANQCKNRCSTDSDCAPSYLCAAPVCHWDWDWADWDMSLPPHTRFTVSGDGATILDGMTGRVWQRGVSDAAKTWDDANAYCASLSSLPGIAWRLPTIIELLSIVEPTRSEPAIDTTVFSLGASKASGDPFWTSTRSTNGSSMRWAVNFNVGSATIDFNIYAKQVRCVR
jgi:hypothetical protein